ncbi:MAG: terminase small subunit [Gammaproteobacteria bacterium]|nr:terminase small subunit [Gammaproteobacteria bacterium]
MAKLTAKQQAFCETYVSNGFNATQAALSAGYSKKTAKDIACENLAKPNIAEYIASFKDEASERALVTVEDVVKGLMKEAQGIGEDTSTSARVNAWKALSDYTGGFDSNKQQNINVDMTHEQWLESLD